jgi:hypothetical protein
MLRSVPQAARVARLLTEAWSRATGVAAASAAHAGSPARPADDPDANRGRPALAGG